MRSPLFTTVLKALPLAAALFTIAADGEACRIIVEDDDDDEECVDLDEVCPSLACDNGNVQDDDGCAICECADGPSCDIDAQPIPECANPIFDEVACAWSCGGDNQCFSDGDCGRGFFCQLSDCGRSDDGSEGDCAFSGVCVQIVSECFSDFDCGDGFRCELNGGGSDGAAPPEDPNGDPDREEEAPSPPPGQCVRVEEQGCFSDEECGFGRHCEFFSAPGGLVAQSGVCVDDAEVSECNFDGDCRDGQICEIRCGQDPNCPECDVCLVIGTCVSPSVPCSSDGDCRDGEVCSLDQNSGAPDARPCFDENGDGQCDDADFIQPPQGICIPVFVDDSCASDQDCAAGEVCALRDADSCVCDASCRDDGNGGCLPCTCPEGGVCVPNETTTRCTQDADCGEGQACEIRDGGDCGCVIDQDGETNCLPCEPQPSGVCVDVTTTCFSDLDCGSDEQCVYDDGSVCPDGTACRPAFAAQGTCQPLTTNPCAAVLCGPDSTCEVTADGEAACVVISDGCFSNEECAESLLCNAGELCLSPPGCDPANGLDCPAVCYGFCYDPRDN